MSPEIHRPAILIVEDESMVLTTLKATLAHENFDVMGCLNPIEALTLAPHRDFAVIISDQRMPGMTGLEFLAECRKIKPNSSRILLTAFVDLATVMAAITRGDIHRFIGKPWLRGELVAAVRDAVQRHDLTVHNQELQAETARLSEQLTEAKRKLEAQALPSKCASNLA